MQYVILTASGVVTAANCAGLLYGAVINNAGTAGTVTFRDGGSGGTILYTVDVAAKTNVSVEFKKPIRFMTDIYATLSQVTHAYITFEQHKAG
jgi:hypothetical protein